MHREEEYDSRGFGVLFRMQRDHFWYRGRHRFLLHAVRRHLGGGRKGNDGLRAIDLGGGCGGWVSTFLERAPVPVAEMALADSSASALEMAATVLPARVERHQVDLLQLPWRNRWDVVFLLDVLEHIPEDERAMREIAQALRPGGYLFVTTPAIPTFWTWNDTVVGHQRRYTKRDFRALGGACGLEVVGSHYFMFLLSFALIAQRWLLKPRKAELSAREAWEEVNKTHRVPPRWLNATLGAVFALETPLGQQVPFPWGTSILGVFRKPA